MAKDFDKEDGVWRTVGGRRIFIRTGQSLAEAMVQSGKFKSLRSTYKKEKEKEKEEAKDKEWEEKVKKLAEENAKNKGYELNEGKEETTKQKEQDEREREQRIKNIKSNAEKAHEDGIDKNDFALENAKHGVDTDKSTKAYNQAIEKRMEEMNKEIEKKESERIAKEKFEVSDLKKKAMETLPKEDIDSHEGDLYIKKTKESEALLNNMKDKDSGLLTTFRDQQTGETWYDIPFANMGDDYKEKYNDIEQEALDRFTEDYGWEDNDSLKNLRSQIDYMRIPGDSIHRTAERLVEGGDYLIYNGDIQEWLDNHGIKYNEDNFFDVYKKTMADSIEKLYNQKEEKSTSQIMNNRLQEKAYQKYLKEHPNSKMKFEDFMKNKK